ncbi:DUF956 family protein [Streptococcus dentiloxodontae]
MAQSLNTKVELSTTGVYYIGLSGNKVGKFLLGDKALEFYPDNNVEKYVQIPWEKIYLISANVSRKNISRHFQIALSEERRLLFASKDSGKILKIAREHIGNDKVVRSLTLIQRLLSRFAKKTKI